MWVATEDLPRSAAHPFYARLNQILDQHDFDEFVEGLCERFYADEGRPSLPPGRYFRLLLIGYFEGLDAERAIAWRAADSFALRAFLGLVLPETPPDHSTISRTRRLIDLRGTSRLPGTRSRPWCLMRDADAASDSAGNTVCDSVSVGGRSGRAFRRGIGASGWHTGCVSKRQHPAGRAHLGAERHPARAYSQCVQRGRESDSWRP
jgi:hypothetical protein